MDIETRIKVTAELCCETARNAAYYRSGWDAPGTLKQSQKDFWVNLNGNFLDMATLAWCFLYGDKKAEFRWQNIIPQTSSFLHDLLAHIGMSEEEFDCYITTMRVYRDKRIAHRDRYLSESPKITYPDLDVAVQSVCFLYQRLCSDYPVMGDLFKIRYLSTFYEQRLKHGSEQYNA